jgi:PleD family two-component response regulator
MTMPPRKETSRAKAGQCPRAPRALGQSRQPAAAGESPEGGRMRRKAILLIGEQSPAMGKIRGILKDWGYQISPAPEALITREDVKNLHFDLILVSLEGNEADKLKLMRRAKKSSPRAKLVVVGHPDMTLPAEGFGVKVDDYLLASFSAMELSTRVDRCLGGDTVVWDHPPEKTDVINGQVLHSLKVKVRDLHTGLLSVKARLNMLILEECGFFDDRKISKMRDMSQELLNLTSVVEDILCNMFICCNAKELYSI